MGTSNGYRYFSYKNYDGHVRCFQLLENFFNPSTLSGTGGAGGSEAAPQIGDVVYSDKSWGKAEDYDGSKTAVGIITSVETDGSVKIVNLKDLRFSSISSTGNFDADNPYSGSYNYTYLATSAKYSEDITAITNYNASGLLNAMKSSGDILVGSGAVYAGGAGTEIISDGSLADNFGEQFLKILNNYDDMIKDTSYQGVNLLNNGKLTVTLNESRTHNVGVDGVDAKYDAIGIKTVEWKSVADVEQALSELVVAIGKLRDYSAMFGNRYQLIQTRQNFTDALIDVLETGADNLVLADMNEESANYLALQTRQQLATNSLSLASQSAQSILSLF